MGTRLSPGYMETIKEKLVGLGRRKKALHVGPGALVDLKAALFQKQREVEKHKKGTDVTAVSTKPVSDKTAAIWRNAPGTTSSKKGKRVAGTEKAERAREISLEEEKELEKSRRALEAKAALYDQLSRGDGLRKMEEEDEEEGEGEGRYLVDFTKKLADEYSHQQNGSTISTPADASEDPASGSSEHYEAANSDEEWVEYEDSLGRTRRCLRKDLATMKDLDRKLRERSPTPDLLSEDMQRERERMQWERQALTEVEGEEEEDGKPIGPVHYQNLQQGEIRSHGTGYYAFSADEEKRKEQMDLLDKLREQTLEQRDKREKLVAKRRAAMAARLAKVREKKKLMPTTNEGGGGGSGVDIADFDFKGSGDAHEDEGGAGVDMAALIGAELSKAREMVEQEVETERSKHVRPWDRGKVVDPIRKRKQELRDERLHDFAPPSIYSASDLKRAKLDAARQDSGGESTAGRADTAESTPSTQSLSTPTPPISGGCYGAGSTPTPPISAGSGAGPSVELGFDSNLPPPGAVATSLAPPTHPFVPPHPSHPHYPFAAPPPHLPPPPPPFPPPPLGDWPHRFPPPPPSYPPPPPPHFFPPPQPYVYSQFTYPPHSGGQYFPPPAPPPPHQPANE